MQGRWRRIGDFWTPNRFGGHGVTFANDAPDPVISRINADYNENYSNGLACVSSGFSLVISPSHAKESLALFDEFNIRVWQQPKDIKRDTPHTRDFYLNGDFYGAGLSMVEKDHHVILQFMDRFNKHFQVSIFPEILKQELLAMFHAITHHDWQGKHLLPASVDLSNINRRKHGQTELTRLLYHEKNPYEEVKQRLLNGDDVNELDEFGDSPLKLAVIKQSGSAMLELLLWYGGNPLVRQAVSRYGGFFNAIEAALAYARPDYVEIIGNELTTIEKNPSTNNSTRVVHSQVYYEDNALKTYFKFSNNRTIKSIIISMQDISDSLKQQVFAYYATSFNTPNPNIEELKNSFSEDFSDDKLIELIFADDKFAGFNLVELLRPDEKTRHLLLHCVYAYLIPEFRGYGFMVLLTFRPAYGLDALLKYNMKTGVFFTAVHFNSYRMVTWKHYPKEQTPEMVNVVTAALDKIFKQCKFHHQGLTSYIIDNVKVNDEKNASAPVRRNERMYRKEILGFNNTPYDPNLRRSAPVLFFVSKDNREKMAQNAERIGFDFTIHTLELTVALAAFLLDLCKNGKAPAAILPWYADQMRASSTPAEQSIQARL